MSRKNITPEQIKSVSASLDDLSGQLADSSGYVSDSSAETMASGTSTIKAVSGNSMTIVQNFNSYLDSVATAFEDADINLSASIADGQSLSTYKVSDSELSSVQGGTEPADMGQNSYYASLPQAEEEAK